MVSVTYGEIATIGDQIVLSSTDGAATLFAGPWRDTTNEERGIIFTISSAEGFHSLSLLAALPGQLRFKIAMVLTGQQHQKMLKVFVQPWVNCNHFRNIQVFLKRG